MIWTRLQKIAQQIRVEDPVQEEILRELSRKDPSITGIIDFEDLGKIPKIEHKPNEPPTEWEFVIQEHQARRAGCLAGGTRIITDKGRIPIQKIVNKRMQINVLSYNFKTKKLEWKKVINWYTNGTSTEWLQLRYSKAKGSIILTPNHEVFVKRNGEILKLHAADVKVGDYMLMPDTALSDDQKQFILGSLLGDGSIVSFGHSNKVFSWGQTKKQYFDEACNLFSNFKIEKRVRLPKKENQKTYYYFRIRHIWFHQLYNLIYRNGKKRICKEWLDQLDERALAVWFMDDGQYTPGGDYIINHSSRYLKRKARSDRGKRVRKHGQLYLYTNCFPYEDVVMLKEFLKKRFDIEATIRQRYYKDQQKTYYYLCINKRNSIERFLQLISPYIMKGMEYKCPLEKVNTYTWKPPEDKNLDIYPVPILEINTIKVPKRKPWERYDIEVEDNHNYFAGSFLVSNSHYDVRLGDPKTGMGYSWALRYLPEPGEKKLAIQQPLHSIDYFNFEGKIPEGYYGAGDVRIIMRGKADILSADEDHIRFNVYSGNTVYEYLLIRRDSKNWLLINATKTREKIPEVPSDKKKYKEIPIEEALTSYLNENYLFSRKDDGIQVVYHVGPDGKIKIFSPRDSTISETGLIEHTYKVPPFGKATAPSFKNSIFRGELFAVDAKTGKFIPINDIIKITHNSTPTARKLIEENKWVPRLTVFDVVQLKGVPVEDTLPYKEKLKIIEQFVNEAGHFEIPAYAIDPDEKIEFVDAIASGKIPETQEGIVIQNLNEAERPKKAKFDKEYDVYVVDIFEASSPNWKGVYAGGIVYSLTPGGPPVGRVGTGFDMATRHDMLVNKEKYIGRVARIKAAGQYASGALRKPVFVAWHPEKGKEFFLEKQAISDPWEKWNEVLIDAPFGLYTKGDIYMYYSHPKIRESILEDIKKNPVIVIQAFSKDYQVLKRNFEGDKIRISDKVDEEDPESYDFWILRRAVEFHPTILGTTDKYIVDIDPGPEVDINELKEVTKNVADMMRKLNEVRDVEIRYSGGRGFYVIGYLKRKMDTTTARQKLKEYLQTNFVSKEPTRFTITTKPLEGQIRLDLSPMKPGGSIRAKYSLNSKTGLISIPVKDLDTFDPVRDANPLEIITSNRIKD